MTRNCNLRMLRIIMTGVLFCGVTLFSAGKAMAIEGHCVMFCDDNSSSSSSSYYDSSTYNAVSAAASSFTSSFMDGWNRGQKTVQLNNLGNQSYEAKDYATALYYYREARTISPNNSLLKRSIKRAEIVIGDVAAELGLNENFFMATKVWTKGKEAGIRQMNESFEKLRVRTMELMQVHNLVDLQTQLKTLRQWKEEGRIRYIGITHSHASAFNDLERVMRAEDLDFVQLNYSIAEPEAAERLLPLAQDRGIAVLANRPFTRGALFKKVRGKNLPEWAKEFDCESWAQFFLKFVISHPAVTCAIPATSKPHHLVDNMKGGTGRLPDESLRRRMFDSI